MIRRAFTIIELLIVVAIILLLTAILLPSLQRVRDQAKMAVCASNLHQIAIANQGYAAENHDHFVPAASDENLGFGGRHRWHGTRRSLGVSSDPLENTFDPRFSPLARYIQGAPALPERELQTTLPSTDHCRLKECPTFVTGRDFTRNGALNAFEAGAGGYGYNQVYIGGRLDLYGATPAGLQTGSKTAEIRQPALTIMFTDAAMLVVDVASRQYVLAEESRSYPPFPQAGPGQAGKFLASPSIRFGHLKRSLCAWVDGHTDAQRLTFSGPYASGIAELQVRRFDLGWFGPRSNDWFDRK